MSQRVCDDCGKVIPEHHGVVLERGSLAVISLMEDPGPWDFCDILNCLYRWAGGR